MKLVGFILSFVVFIVLVFVFILKLVPGQTIVESLPETFLQTGDVICSYPVRISGDSMEPEFQSGELVIFNKCIQNLKKLPADTVIVFQDEENVQRVGRIQSYSGLDDKFEYKISQDNRSTNPILISPEKIISFLEK